jgi:CubicO group peptidase (beta-lactamase class C family)
MTPDTVVWIASMTKAITGAAAMQQVERGKLGLDSPAKAVVPYLGEVQVLEGWDAAGKPKTRKPKRDITLRHLLTHTAGFSYEIWNPDIVKYQTTMGVPGITGCENKALTTPLLFDPGERWDYGINIDWAGKMVEAASGQKLGQYLKDNVLGPLGMDSTAFFITPSMRERWPRSIIAGPDGALAPDMALEIPQQPEFEMGGGGLYGTAGDYAKFVRMMLNRGRSDRGDPVLKPETVAQMSKNAMGDCRVGLLKTEMPPLSNDAEFFPGLDKQWGLSFMINNGGGANRPLAGQPWPGRGWPTPTTDRSGQGYRRRLRHAGPAVRRRQVAAALLRLREGDLRRLTSTPARILQFPLPDRGQRSLKGQVRSPSSTDGEGLFALFPRNRRA